MPWYTPLHTLYALVHTTTHLICMHLICLSTTTTHLTYLGTHTHHYTPFISWYTPLHTLLHAFAHTTNITWNTPLVTTFLGRHHYPPYMPWYTPLHTFYALVHTTIHHTCLGTHILFLGTHPTCFSTHHYTPHSINQGKSVALAANFRKNRNRIETNISRKF